MNTGTAKIKKVYHLRKTVSSLKPQQKLLENQSYKDDQTNKIHDQKKQSANNNSFNPSVNNSIIRQRETYTANNQSMLQNNVLEDNLNYFSPIVDGPQLAVNLLFIGFEQKLDCIQTKQIKVRNIGSSAIYYQWVFKNQPKLNQNAVKDLKPHFFCHYNSNTIRPGQEISFYFSFISQIPGYFSQQCELRCQPALITKIPLVKLQGKAYIDDQWKVDRQNFLKELQQSTRLCSVSELLSDTIDQIQLPKPQRPNVKDLKIAEELFQLRNQNHHLYFNPYLHKWFNELFEQIWVKGQKSSEQPYWDQSVQTVRSLIQDNSSLDEVQKICYFQRLQHYIYLSTFSLPDKSQLYGTIRNFLTEASYKLGGQFSDTVKKQLDMWQVPFRQPSDNDTEQELKARKQQVEKIKAEWLKRTKKKKWGQQQDKQMLADFKEKVGKKMTQQVLQRFHNFQESAQYTKLEKIINKNPPTFNSQKYFHFLERLKTVKQQPLQGKKVLFKFNLKLKNNCDQELKNLEEYLIKKQEQHKRIQQQKLQGNAQKKKKVTKKKGKNQKQQQDQKPLVFDFLSILDQENWNGIVQTFKTILQKSPYLILIGCTYGPRFGRFQQKFSTKFLLQHFRTIEPSIQFMDHENLYSIGQKLQSQAISQGSMFLLQNLNFLSSETLNCQQIQTQIDEANGGVQKEKITKRNVVYPEIRKNLDKWALKGVDIIVDQDRFIQKASGISSYARKQVILGGYWWNYIGLSLRAVNQTIVFGGDLNPGNLLLLYRLATYCRRIFLTSILGLKFRLAIQNKSQLCGFKINQAQLKLIRSLVYEKGSEQVFSSFGNKIVVPYTFKLLKKTKSEVQEQAQNYQIIHFDFSSQDNLKMDTSNCKVVDIGHDIPNQIASIQSGHIFILGNSYIQKINQKIVPDSSVASILKSLYKMQELKRSRHSIEVNTPAGINYESDIVVYLVGMNAEFIEEIEFKQKKVKKVQNIQGEEEEAQEQIQQEGEQQQGKKKIDLVGDYKLQSLQCLKKIMCGNFNHGLKNVGKYNKPRKL